MIPLRIHNILDYVAGVVLIFIPAIFGFADIVQARSIFLIAGLGLIVYSLLTKYQYALWRIIPLGVHMTLDVIVGLVVMLSPWVLAYRGELTSGQEIVHYVSALVLFGLVALTRPRSEAEAGVDRGTTAFPESTSYPGNRKAG